MVDFYDGYDVIVCCKVDLCVNCMVWVVGNVIEECFLYIEVVVG